MFGVCFKLNASELPNFESHDCFHNRNDYSVNTNLSCTRVPIFTSDRHISSAYSQLLAMTTPILISFNYFLNHTSQPYHPGLTLWLYVAAMPQYLKTWGLF